MKPMLFVVQDGKVEYTTRVPLFAHQRARWLVKQRPGADALVLKLTARWSFAAQRSTK